MPRLGNGTYQLPLPDVAGGEVIESVWANDTMTDIATALTDSLSRSGSGGMTDSFQNDSGSQTAPGITWTANTQSGWWFDNTGPFMYATINQNNKARISANGVEVFEDGGWQGVLWVGGPGTVPTGTADGEILEWDETTTQAWVLAPAPTAVPSTAINGAIMRWDETTNQEWEVTNALTISDAGNVVIGNLALIPDGTEADPSWAFSADLDTGFYRPADNQFAISTGGTGRVHVDEVGVVKGLWNNFGAGNSLAQFQKLTQVEYDGIVTPDDNTCYLIVG